MGKIILRTGNIFYNHIEFMCVTCLTILKMGIPMGTMKSLEGKFYITNSPIMGWPSGSSPQLKSHNGPTVPLHLQGPGAERSGDRFKNTYELLNLRAIKISMLYKNHIFQCMGKMFCVEFQRVPLKFHTKYLAHTLKNVDFIHRWKFTSS